MARRFWLPAALPELVNLLTNFSAKIGSYGETLGMLPAQVTSAQDLCTHLIAAYNYAENARATMQAVTQWRDLVFNGEPVGSSALPVPEFASAPDLPFKRGTLQLFIRLRDQIVANDNYTFAIGEDLGIVGPEITPKPPEDVTPNLKVSVSSGDTVKIGGSMQRMSGMRITYKPTNGAVREVAFITSTPAEIYIAKDNDALPENGTIQAQFYKKNEPYGNPSAIYPVTLA